MLQFLVPLILVISSATSLRDWQAQHHVLYPKTQVASESQVKFALENKYDDTGPGAKQPEYAYNTYKNLEDALVAYLDDPDTKLPEHERAKAINKLTSQSHLFSPPNGKQFHKYSQYKILDKPQFRPLSQQSEAFVFPASKVFKEESNVLYSLNDDKDKAVKPKELEVNNVMENYYVEKKVEPFKFQKIHSVKGSPLSLAHYTRDPEVKWALDQFDPHPKYSYSYGVHDKSTGDSKTAQESRDGGTVHGFYSFIDADGKTRTVHYTADDRQGFRAKVQKSN